MAGAGSLHEQDIAVGPAATQVIARDLGTSGGGFFNANSAHPFESPTPLSDFLLLLLQTMIAAALTYTYGRIVGDTRAGMDAILAVMLLVLAMFDRDRLSALKSVGNAGLCAAQPADLIRYGSASRAGTWKAKRSGSA